MTMPARPHPGQSVERFAEVSAQLASPFADRGAVLLAAEVSAEEWARLEGEWLARFATEEGASLAARFGDAYARASQRAPTPTTEAAASAGPRFLSDAQPWRAEAALVGLEVPGGPPPRHAPAHPAPGPQPLAAQPAPAASGNPLAGTADLDLRHLRPALPFAPAPEGGAQPPPSAPGPAPAPSELGGTLPMATRLPTPVLPFRAPGEEAPFDATLDLGTRLPVPEVSPFPLKPRPKT